MSQTNTNRALLTRLDGRAKLVKNKQTGFWELYTGCWITKPNIKWSNWQSLWYILWHYKCEELGAVVPRDMRF